MAKKRYLTEEEIKERDRLKKEAEDLLGNFEEVAKRLRRISEIYRDSGRLQDANKFESVANGANNSAAEVHDILKYRA